MFKPKSPADGIQVYDGEGHEPLSVQQRNLRRQNKLKTWPKGNWRWVGRFTNERGQPVRFCYSLHRNEAGYFFAWREVRVPIDSKPTANPLFSYRMKEKGTMYLLKRFDVIARRQKHRARAFAVRKAAGWEELCENQRKAKAKHVEQQKHGKQS